MRPTAYTAADLDAIALREAESHAAQSGLRVRGPVTWTLWTRDGVATLRASWIGNDGGVYSTGSVAL